MKKNILSFLSTILILSISYSRSCSQTTVEVFPYNANFASGYVKPGDTMYSGEIMELGTGGCDGYNKGFIVFDLGGIPATAVIQAAVITLQGIGCNPAEGVFGRITGLPANPMHGTLVTHQNIKNGPVYADKLDWDIWAGPMSSPFTATGITAMQKKIGTAFCVGIDPPISGAVRRFGGYDSNDATAPRPILRITYTTGSAAKPAADFHTSAREIFTGQPLDFYDNSGNYPTSWLWDFGDSTTSALKNPVHTYTDTGMYTVKLKVTNGQGQDSITKLNYIRVKAAPAKPIAAFDADNTSPDEWEPVQFTDLSLGEITDWEWNFGDTEISLEQNPEHIYAANGVYSVTLIVSGPGGADTIEKSNYINVGGQVIEPVAGFSVDQSGGLTVMFTDISANSPTSWSWDFGDSSLSAERDPVHVYDNDGTYLVCLTAANAAGSNTYCQSITLTTVGIAEQQYMRIHPNPSNGIITLSNPLQAEATAVICNLVGQQVVSMPLRAGENRMSLEHLGPGIYLCKIQAYQCRLVITQ